MKKYTNTWNASLALPKIGKGARTYTPTTGELVGGKFNDHAFISFFQDDMPYIPTSAPVLEQMIEDELVRAKEDKEFGTLYLLRTIVCRQCSCTFPSDKPNKLYCSDCAEERKKNSDRESWLRRKARNAKGGNGNTKRQGSAFGKEEFALPIGKVIGELEIFDQLTACLRRSVYLCRCECGRKFSAAESVLTSGMVQMCPVCVNRAAGFAYRISSERLGNPAAWVDLGSLAKYRSGFLEAQGKINESLVLCNCGCGRRIVISTEDFLAGNVTSCGCIKNDIELVSRAQCKYEGQKIGFSKCLMATRKSAKEPKRGSIHYGSQWLSFECECGRQFFATRGQSIAKKTTMAILNCGCKREDVLKQRKGKQK